MTISTGFDSHKRSTPSLGHLVILSSCHLVMIRLGKLACSLTIVLLLALGAGCHKLSSASPHDEVSSTSASEEFQDSPWFVDITEDAGLTFVHDAGSLGRHFMPEMVGSGAAFFDFDNDGRLDIYLLQNGG